MFHEYLKVPYAISLLLSPLVFLIFLWIGFRKYGATSFMAIGAGILLGPIGSTKLSSIVPDALGLEIILYAFAFCWWFCVSFAFVLFLIEFHSDPPNKRLERFWLIFPLIMIAMIIVANVYVPRASNVAYKAVKD